MNNKKLSLILVISMVLLSISLIPVSANQISVIGAATNTTTTQQTVEIPTGDYHVYIGTDGYLWTAVAYCTATIDVETLFSWSTSENIDTWTGQVTFPNTTTITFTFELQNSMGTDHMNFQIIFTDIDVATITKSSIIAEAPYGLGIIGIALIGMACVYIRRTRRKGS